MSRNAKKTDRHPYKQRSFTVRAFHRERTDLHKLAEVLIRLTLQETGESRADDEATRVPDTYRAPTDGLAASEAARQNQTCKPRDAGCCGLNLAARRATRTDTFESRPTAFTGCSHDHPPSHEQWEREGRTP